MEKYFKKKNYMNGEVISLFIKDLCNKYNYNDILFVRTPTTGSWMDQLLKKNTRITRFIYDTRKAKIENCHKSTIIVKQEKMEVVINSLNKKFDLICIDPFHEYKESTRDFFYFYSLLKDDGILISHDCFPKEKSMASAKYKSGSWSGSTYAAFIKFAVKNQNLFYGVLETDTGIGIISKQKKDFLTNNLDRDKQKIFLNKFKKNSADTYAYFRENSKNIMGAFSTIRTNSSQL
jgi:hypothetical protein